MAPIFLNMGIVILKMSDYQMFLRDSLSSFSHAGVNCFCFWNFTSYCTPAWLTQSVVKIAYTKQ